MTAYMYTRQRKDGSVAVQVKWMDVDRRRWQAQTFNDPSEAAEFRTAVTARGDRWPKGRIPGASRTWRDATVTKLDDVYDSHAAG